jgi:hypothetical protein
MLAVIRCKIFCLPVYYKNVKIKIYKIYKIYLASDLCGYETWSLTLREERRLRVFQNRVLRRIFGPKRDKVTGERRRLHNKELYALYSSPKIHSGDQIKKTGMGKACRAYGKRRGTFKILMGTPEGRKPLEGPRCR